ncbi:hypothetical protein MKX03_000198, partial [Papaver bracteatum]
MQSLSRGAPHGVVVVSPLPNQRITTYSNLIRFTSSPFKNSLLVSRLKVCSSMKFIPNVRKELFGITVKIKGGERVFISKRNSNGVITKFDHQVKNGERVNWRFTTGLEIEMSQIERIKKEVYKIFEEDKDLEQEGSFSVVHHFYFAPRTGVFLVSCFTKTNTHEDYFAIR